MGVVLLALSMAFEWVAGALLALAVWLWNGGVHCAELIRGRLLNPFSKRHLHGSSSVALHVKLYDAASTNDLVNLALHVTQATFQSRVARH